MTLYLGGPIWAYKGWTGSFYPEGTKPADYLWEYARRLNTVEGNTTFYAVPAHKTLEKWVEETPETFRFCPKLPRAISHAGKLVDHLEEADVFLAVMSQLGPRLGPLFLQLPPRYPPAWIEDLKAFLEGWPFWAQLAVEVRHTGWFAAAHHQTLNALLANLNMARVVIDTRPIRDLSGEQILEGSVYQRLLEARQRKPDLPILPERTADFAFLRYIGHPQLEQNEPFLEEWAEYLARWLDEGAQAYVFCHCPDERLDPILCRALHRRVAARTPVPPLPWDELEAGTARQERLF
ncbi:MAG TPA: DUF72 domain-containing protein [Anaerolineales bacterium]|nr:DUF72 domain-containing protein [Anaerolineales bacterium]